VVSESNEAGLGQEEFLSIRITDPGLDERLLLIGHPIDGVVRVREWRTATLNTEGEDYDIPAGELLEQLETALAARRNISEEMYRIRRWLEG
jgi:hypothetical protein